MFRIFLTAGRSAQLRSPTLLRYNRLVTPRTSTRQQSSTAGKPIDHQTQSPKAASITTPAEALPSPQPPSAAKDAIGSETQHGRNPPNHDDRTAEDTAYPPKPINGSATESAQDLRNAQEMDSATPVKRRMGRPPKPVEPKGPPKKRGPKPKPKPEKPPPKKRDPKPKPKVEEIPKPRGCPPGSASSAPTTKRRRGKVRLELTENVSADVKTITLSKIESASKRSKFVSENIRADFLPYLAWARGHSQGRSIGDNNRINIVSESLCGMVSGEFIGWMRLTGLR
jgi:transcription factor 1